MADPSWHSAVSALFLQGFFFFFFQNVFYSVSSYMFFNLSLLQRSVLMHLLHIPAGLKIARFFSVMGSWFQLQQLTDGAASHGLMRAFSLDICGGFWTQECRGKIYIHRSAGKMSKLRYHSGNELMWRLWNTDWKDKRVVCKCSSLRGTCGLLPGWTHSYEFC